MHSDDLFLDESHIESLQPKWEKLLDLLADIMEVPAAVILRARDDALEVSVKSQNPDNAYQIGQRLSTHANPHCHAVLRSRQPVVHDALTDGDGAIPADSTSRSFVCMGHPIDWPNGQLFGTICVLDNKPRQFPDHHKRLLGQFAQIVQGDLAAHASQQKLEAEIDRHLRTVHSLQESEERFRRAFATSQAGIVITDMQSGLIIDANEGYAAVTGYTREELIGHTTMQRGLYFATGDRASIIERLNRNDIIHFHEMRIRAKSGETRIIQGSVEKIQLSGQQCLLTTIHDITQLRSLEQELQRANERYTLAIRSAEMGVWDWDVVNNDLYWEDQMFRLYEVGKDEFSSTYEAWLSRLLPQEKEFSLEETQRALRGDKEYDTEFRIRCPGGGVKHIKAYGDVIRDDDGKPLRMVGVNFDITERTRMEEKLIASESRYKSIFQNNHAVQLLIDSQTGDIFDANPAACEYYGFAPEEFRRKKLWDINPAPIEFILDKLKTTYEQGNNLVITRHRRRDGAYRDVEVFSGRVDIDSRKLAYAIVHDITERKQAEDRLLESERRFRLFVENAPDGIFVQTDYRLAYVNRKTVELFGAGTPDELLGRYIPDLFASDYQDQVKDRIQTLNENLMSVPLREERIVRLDGAIVDVEVSAVPFQFEGSNGALVFMRDITERRIFEKNKLELEIQLRQKQKLESIGTLAGGVAHEINNPINGIINYAQLIQDDASTGERTKELSKEIIHEGNRIAEIVKDLLSFSRQDKHSHSPAQIYDIINHTVSLIRTIIRHDQISLELNIPAGLPPIKCRSQQIQQVLMNLITNARDALNARYKGFHEDKRILLDCIMFHREGRRWFKITVEDHGAGIPEAILDKVFDPFFTTKPRQEGTGLGLSVSHSIVKDHHGELYFETSPGQYTRAVLILPVDNGWSLEESP